MKMLTKLYNYLQKLRYTLVKLRKTDYTEQVMTINPAHTEPKVVYTRRKPPKLYDWQREEAKHRHPSNYRNKNTHRKGENI